MDPVIFEILRHRLLTIAREGAITLRNVSGSPSVAMSNDCNVAFLDESGEAVLIGPTIATHALSCGYASKYVRQEYSENPGIYKDDMFLTNDPYVCTPHQTCAVVVAPVFWEDRLVCWTGAGIHVADAGGPTPGQVSLGAQSIWEEALPLPPIKIVDRGLLRRDVEQDYLRRSRTAAQNAIDLRAMISANRVMTRRLQEVMTRCGPDGVKEVMGRIVETAEIRFKSVLKQVPDGSWSEVAYLDYWDRGKLEIYTCRLTLTKNEETLTFDFSGSSKQAPAVINVTLPALEGYLVRTVIAMFGFAVPPCPAGVFRVCRVVTEPGTFVHCSWPAGVCKGTTSGTYAVFQAVTSCLSQMLSEGSMARNAITGFRGHMALFDFSGPDREGQPFAGVFSEGGMSPGSGARGTQDGIDTGSGSEPEASIPNVETMEQRYPILYLYRRQAIDSGGAGKFRGGTGVALALKPHGVASIPNVVFHSHGIECPSTLALYGGYPGGCNEVTICRRADAARQFKAGIVPGTAEEIGGEREVPAFFGRAHLDADDVLHFTAAGGGGWGDPLERLPALVLKDIEEGVVSRPWATELYGVIFGDGDGIDTEKTEAHRTRLRERRKIEGGLGGSSPPLLHHRDTTTFGGKIGICVRCSEELSSPRLIEIPWQSIGPYFSALESNKLFRLVAWSCPNCGTLALVKPFLSDEAAGWERTKTSLT